MNMHTHRVPLMPGKYSWVWLFFASMTSWFWYLTCVLKKWFTKISEMWCWEFFFFITFFLTSEITWKNLILIWNVNYLMLLILVFSVFELKYLLEMCNLTYLTMNGLWSEKSSAFWSQNLQLKQLYFFSSSQPITPATSTNTNPWNENIYLYLKKAYLPAWKLNVDFNYLKNTGNCMLLIFISKKLHKDL